MDGRSPLDAYMGSRSDGASSFRAQNLYSKTRTSSRSSVSDNLGVTLLAYGLLLLGILATLGGLVYYADTHWKTSAGVSAGKEEVSAEWREAKRLQREADQAAARKASAKLGDKDDKRKVEYRTIEKTVDRIVVEYRDRPCLDELGLRVAGDAIRGKASAAGGPNESLPATKPTN